MTLEQLQTIEETHTLGYATYYSPDGNREIEVEVCTHCDQDPNRTEAANWPCETIEEAYWKHEKSNKTAVITTADTFFIDHESVLTIMEDGHAIAETTIPTQTPEGFNLPIVRILLALKQLGYQMVEGSSWELPNGASPWFTYNNGNVLITEVEPVN